MRTTLGDICEIQLGKMLSPKAHAGGKRGPYLRNQNVQWGRFKLDDIVEMDFDDRERIKFSLRPGDLLVCEGGEPGRAAIWEGQIQECFYQKALHRLRPHADKATPDFLLYRLWLGGIRKEFTGSQGQTTIAHLPAERLSTIPVELPDLETQRRIAKRLKEQMSVVELARFRVQEQLLEVKQLAASLLDHALCVDVAPVRLAEIALVVAGRHILGEHHNIERNGVPYITGPSDFGDLKATPSRWTPSPDVLCQQGDLLITVKGAGVGKLNFAPDDPTCIGRQIMAIRSRTDLVDAWYLYFIIKQQFKYISEQATGATIPGLSIEQIEGIQLHVPPLPTQRRIAARLREQFEHLQQLKAALCTQLSALDKLPGAYLREVFGSLTAD